MYIAIDDNTSLHHEVSGLVACVLEGVDRTGEPVDPCAYVTGQPVARRPIRAVLEPDDSLTSWQTPMFAISRAFCNCWSGGMVVFVFVLLLVLGLHGGSWQ